MRRMIYFSIFLELVQCVALSEHFNLAVTLHPTVRHEGDRNKPCLCGEQRPDLTPRACGMLFLVYPTG
jgi:hypothetical protein